MAKDSSSKKSGKRSKPPSPQGQLPTGKLALIKDPRVYQLHAKLPPPMHKRLTGLDLASSCGISFCDIIPGHPVTGATIVGGQWDLSLSNWDTNSLRLIRLKQFLSILEPDLLFYEEVKYVGQSAPPGANESTLTALVARAVSGAQVVHTMQAILITWAEERNIPCEAVPIGTLKKYATGRGNANKKEMIEACNEKFKTDLSFKYANQSGATLLEGFVVNKKKETE